LTAYQLKDGNKSFEVNLMSTNRIVLILLLLGGLTLLAIQNRAPEQILPLVFLGRQTPALPLGIWVGLAIAFGIVTSLLLQSLGYLANFSPTRPPEATVPKSPHPQPRRQPTVVERETRYSEESASDWENSRPTSNKEVWDEEWEIDNQPAATNRESPKTTPSKSERGAKSYEAKQEPTTSNQSGSVYSYGYREPSSSGAGKSESVYDADYRVIVPPYQQPTPTIVEDDWQPKAKEDEDWGFDEDEFDDRGNAPRSR
jgi:hypothetical protein